MEIKEIICKLEEALSALKSLDEQQLDEMAIKQNPDYTERMKGYSIDKVISELRKLKTGFVETKYNVVLKWPEEIVGQKYKLCINAGEHDKKSLNGHGLKHIGPHRINYGKAATELRKVLSNDTAAQWDGDNYSVISGGYKFVFGKFIAEKDNTEKAILITMYKI